MFGSMFRDPGFSVMDEPGAALSFTSCLPLVALMHQLGHGLRGRTPRDSAGRSIFSGRCAPRSRTRRSLATLPRTPSAYLRHITES